MKKKLIGTLFLTCLSMSIVGTAVLLAHHDGFSGSSKATTYYVRLNSNNAYQGVDQTIPTSSGQYALPFTYSGAQTETGYHCKLSENGTIKNSTDIQYITSVHAVWSGSYAQLKIRYSPDNTSWGEYSLLSSDMETFVEGKPYFFEVTSTGGEISLSSLTIHYSCSPRGDDSLKSVKIYATNDIHGQVYPENPQDYLGRIGIGKMMTYIKENKDGNTLALDQGDTWQGSIYSNYNYGNLINDVMTYAGYDARTIGNHDFDWGTNKIIANTARKYGGRLMPTLAANVYDYDFSTKVVGNVHQDEIGGRTIVKTLENGLKVGVVGVIGKDQITSISSIYTTDITFTDHVQTIKDEATSLRREGCDIVIASIHADQAAVMNQSLGDYVDLVLCGHSHNTNIYNEDDLYFAQFGEYTTHLGEIELTYNPATHKVTTSITSLTAKGIDDAVSSIDSTIDDLITDSYSDCEEEANQVIVKDAVGSFNYSHQAANLMCEAIYDEAKKEGYNDIVLAFANSARHDLGKSGEHTTWKYSDIYEAFPFNNEIVIFEATYEEMRDEVKNYNRICKSNETLEIVPGETYKIACLDYLAFHNDSNREYDYFPSIINYNIKTMDKLKKNYREILKDYLLDKGYDQDGKTLSYSDYSYNLPKFNRYDIKVKTYTVNFYLNDGTDFKYYTQSITASYRIIDYLPENPTWRNHAFGGWYKEPECINPLTSSDLAQNIDLYAKWVDYTPTEYSGSGSFTTITYQLIVQDSEMNMAEVGVWLSLSDKPNMKSDEQFSFDGYLSDLMITELELTLDADGYELLGHDENNLPVYPDIIQIDASTYKYVYSCYSRNIWFENLDTRIITLGNFTLTLETYA